MSHNELVIQRLLTRRDINAMLEPFGLNAAIVRADGKLFCSVGEWDDADQIEILSIADQSLNENNGNEIIQRGSLRCYPLFGSGRRLGSLVTQSFAPATPLEKALHQSLNTFLTQAVEKREVSNEALERYREINLLYRIGETIGTTLDAKAIPQMILDESLQAIKSDVGMVVLWLTPDGKDWEIKASFGEGANRIALLDIADTLLNQLDSPSRPAIITTIPEATLLDGLPKFKSMLWAPLKAQGIVSGGVLLGRLEGNGIYTANDEKLFMALTSQAAIAVENARLHENTLEKDRLEREMQLARNVQGSLIPQRVPDIPGWEFAAWWQPAREVSGDFYDFILRKQSKITSILDTLSNKDQAISKSNEQLQLGAVIADVSDKGMHAALFMALTRSIIRASTFSPRKPAENITQANRLICADAVGGMFVTLFYAQLDVLRSEITYVNCGHNPPFFYRSATDTISELGRTGIMIGFDDTWEFEQQTITIKSGDFIALYTDGISEAVNIAKEQFGEERLMKVFNTHRQKSAQQILEALQQELTEHMKGAPQYDDITFVIMKKV